MGKKIYVITAGEYSDYGIVRIFSTEIGAKNWIGPLTDRYRIEEYNLDDDSDKRFVSSYCTMCLFSGNVMCTGHGDSDPKKLAIFDREPEYLIEFTNDSEDVARTIKICGEKRAELIALNRVASGIYDFDNLNLLRGRGQK
jgi:hypothetical protein